MHGTIKKIMLLKMGVLLNYQLTNRLFITLQSGHECLDHCLHSSGYTVCMLFRTMFVFSLFCLVHSTHTVWYTSRILYDTLFVFCLVHRQNSIQYTMYFIWNTPALCLIHIVSVLYTSAILLLHCLLYSFSHYFILIVN